MREAGRLLRRIKASMTVQVGIPVPTSVLRNASGFILEEILTAVKHAPLRPAGRIAGTPRSLVAPMDMPSLIAPAGAIREGNRVFALDA